MKRLLICMSIILHVSMVFGQTLVDNLTLTQYNNEPEIKALQSITLKPPFTISAGNSVKLYIVRFPNLVSSPTVSKNYILTKVFKVPGVTAATLNTVRSIGDENQTIQYFDGLGRPSQTVTLMASPTYQDIVQHMEYDGFNRENFRYLPYAEQASGNGSFKTSAKTNQKNFYKVGGGWDITVAKTTDPYAVTIFEDSPLNRVIEQGQAGNTWKPAMTRGTGGRTVVSEYGTNVTDEVKQWQVNSTNSGANSSVYAEGMLYKTITKNENWIADSAKAGTIEEYRDFENRMVLKRIWSTKTKALDTYYVYDEFGDLRYVIPPGYIGPKVTDNDADFNEMIYAYRYDENRRLVEKKIPGKGWEYLVYNSNDQTVLTQNAMQRGRKEWNYIRYDAFGRITSSGLYINTNTTQQSRQQMSDYIQGLTAPLWEMRIGMDYPNPSTTFPLAGPGITIKPLMVNYYDNYTFSGATALPEKDIVKSAMIKKMLTGTLVYKDDGTAPLLTVSYYDDFGRLIQNASQNHIGGTDYVTNKYSFAGELLSSSRIHKDKSGTQTSVVTENDYDHVGRLKSTKNYINDAAKQVVLVKNEYNELGQLKKKNLGGDKNAANFHTSVSYSYNERGWIDTVSSAQFNYVLKYNDASVGKQYNGNIAEQYWAHGSAVLSNVFKYSYDAVDRLKSGISTGTIMSEVMSYDDRGNIKTLTRNIGNTTATNTTTYSYVNNNSSNRLGSLAGGITGTYSYDLNGNVTKDYRGMNLSYNYLNLPDSAWNNGATVKVGYLYDAAGTKLRKYSTQGGTREYVNGIEYNGSSIELIHTREGVAFRNNDGTYTYRYNLSDHLGNVRSTIYRNPNNGLVEVLQKDDYYPFGKQRVVAGGNNKYLYNGKEIQNELNGQYDYGARFYDAEIGRFNVVDRFAEKYSSLSPYQYAANNPALNIDVNGDSIWVSINTTSTDAQGNSTITTARYYYGSDQKGNYGFIGSDGNLYNGSDAFTKEVSAALGSLRSGGKTGLGLVNDLMNSTNNVEIAKGNKNVADAGGTYITWNPAKLNSAPDENGSLIRPAYVGLGHEMAHIQDVWNGTYNSRRWRTIQKTDDETGDIPNAEIYATHIENMIRAENGLPLRVSYAHDASGKADPSTRIIIRGTRKSLYYNLLKTTNYKKMTKRDTPYIYLIR